MYKIGEKEWEFSDIDMFFSSYEILSLFPERLFQFNSFVKISFFSPEHPPKKKTKQNKTKQKRKKSHTRAKCAEAHSSLS